jgi:anti-sigma regulatory factor (Ser/Thr protein kinase)
MKQHTYIYPSVSEAEETFYEDLRKALTASKIDPAISRRFMLALSEAFTNALVHGNQRDPNKLITVRLQVMEDELRADIIDQGNGGLARIARRPEPTDMSEGGRGVDLIRHFSPGAEFSEDEAGGLKVTIRMARRSCCEHKYS